MSDAALDYISDRLDRLETKLDKALDDHESRLRRMERWMWSVPPSIVTAIAAIIVALVKT